MASASAPRTLPRSHHRIVLVVLLLAGTFMLLYKFPSVPSGLHQDEMSEAYESYSLLKTGADRWGNRFPVYFIGWGSGQNVMQSYLSIPIVAIGGLTPFTARSIPLLAGLLSLPLFFFTVRRWHGETVALTGLLFFAFSAWHVVNSRSALECNPEPFFVLLGLFTFSAALRSRSWSTILPCLLPFVFAMYTYGIAVVVLPTFLVLLFLMGMKEILAQRWKWLGAFAVGMVAVLPLLFFVLKNYVTKRNYGFERFLPFTAQLLPVSRLSQVRGERGSALLYNLRFLRHGMQDGQPVTQVPGIPPVAVVLLLLAVVGIGYQIGRTIRARRILEPFLPWLLANIPLIVLVPLRIHESINVFAPLLAMAATGFVFLLRAIPEKRYRLVFAAIMLGWWGFSTAHFVQRYFGTRYAEEGVRIFHPALPAALAAAQTMAGQHTPIYVSEEVLLNYVDVLFYTKTDPLTFQHSGATYAHPDFGRYRFSRASAQQTAGPMVYVLSGDELPLCAKPAGAVAVGEFLVGSCR